MNSRNKASDADSSTDSASQNADLEKIEEYIATTTPLLERLSSLLGSSRAQSGAAAPGPAKPGGDSRLTAGLRRAAQAAGRTGVPGAMAAASAPSPASGLLGSSGGASSFDPDDEILTGAVPAPAGAQGAAGTPGGTAPTRPETPTSAKPGRARNAVGRAIGGMGRGAAGLAGGIAGAAGMIPSLAAAAGNPAAFAQDMLAQAPDMAAGLMESGGAAGAPVGAEAQGRPPAAAKTPAAPAGARTPGKGGSSVGDAATSAANGLKKSTDAARASTDAMKKSTDAVKGSSKGFKDFSTQLTASASAQNSAGKSTENMTKSQKNLNSAMRQNPLGMVVTAISAAISVITLLVQNWDKVKIAFDWVFKNVLQPVGKWFSDTWSGTVVPMFKTSVETVGGFFSSMGDTVKGVWDGIIGKVKDVVRVIANIIGSLPNISILGFSPQDVSNGLLSFVGDKKADGGLLNGPGGPRDDVIPVLASNGEYIVNAASTAQNLPLLEAINSGAAPKFADGGQVHSTWSSLAGSQALGAANNYFGLSDSDTTTERTGWDFVRHEAATGLASAFSSFASGMIGDALGLAGADGVPHLFQAVATGNNAWNKHQAKKNAPKSEETTESTDDTEAPDAGATQSSGGLTAKALALIDFAKGVQGAPYKWGGTNWGDCSGAVSALANKVAGLPEFATRFATGNQGPELRKRGARDGRGPDGSLSIGWYHNGGEDGHTAATLPNGVNFEMGGSGNYGKYGGMASGADNPLFTQHMHFPPEMFMAAGGSISGPGSSIGDMIPAWLSDGEFVVNAKSANANRGLLELINQNAGALAGLTPPTLFPTRALSSGSGGGECVDQSTTIHLSTPDVDTAFQKAKTWEAQRALTYTGRWS